MNKHILHILGLFVATFSMAQMTITLEGQSTDISGTTEVLVSKIGKDNHINFYIKNLSGEERFWKIKRLRLDAPPTGWQDYVCWGLENESGTCYGHNAVNPWSTPEPVQHVDINTGKVESGLLNGESALANLHADLRSTTNPGTVTYRYYVYEEGKAYEDSIDVTYTAVVGLNEGKNIPVSMSAYPNPASSMLTVATTGLNDEFVLRVSDVLGKVVYEEVTSSTKKVDVSDFKNGVYLITVINDGSVVQTKRVVVKH